MEQELATRRVGNREVDERAHEHLQGITRIRRQIERRQLLLELPVAVGEHRVVQRELGVEVGVQRRLAHAHRLRQRVQ